MKIAVASDHAGFDYKERIRGFLDTLRHDVHDFGTFDGKTPVDYPDFVRPAAEAVARGQFERGIVLGGSGNGEAIAANKVRGIRCALCWSVESARLSRMHNDANVLSLGQRLLGLDETLEIVRIWLETGFEGGRHVARLRKLE